VTREDFLARLKRPTARLQNSRTDWYRVQNKAGEPAEIYIYDEIGYFGDSAKAFAKDLTDIKGEVLTVHLNSPGGDIFDGLAIYQALKDHPASVTVKIDGLAASIASVIAMAGDRIIMAPKASMMIHDGWTMAVGNAAEMRKTADLLDKQSSIIASVYADRAGQSAEFWRDRMGDDTWYNADEALEAGLVDEIEGRIAKEADEFDLTVYAHSGRDKAPAPVIKPPALEPVVEPVAAVVPAVEPDKDEPEPFTWDFSAFRSALREGVK
jgi:ATP-dependent protease ClpP protease subunit